MIAFSHDIWDALMTTYYLSILCSSQPVKGNAYVRTNKIFERKIMNISLPINLNIFTSPASLHCVLEQEH